MSWRDALIFRTIHFLSKMNCSTEDSFPNCSLVAPSSLSDCLFTAPLHAHHLFSLMHSHRQFFFSVFKHKYEEFPCELRCLNHLGKSPLARVYLPSPGQLAGSLRLSLPPAARACRVTSWCWAWRSDPSSYGVPEELQNASQSKSAMGSWVIVVAFLIPWADL